MFSLILVSDTMAPSPDFGSALGGKEITITGACFNTTHGTVKCQFGDVWTTGRVISRWEALCVTPLLTESGSVSLRVQSYVDGKQLHTYSSTFRMCMYNLLVLVSGIQLLDT